MKTHSRSCCALLISLLVCLQFTSLASAEAELVEGRDFLRVPAQPASTREALPGRVVEILEFFSYGCSACYEFRPLAAQWIARLPANTTVERIPTALGRREWQPLVRMYFALRAAGHYERLDQALFDAIHRDRLPLFDEAALMAWVAQQGIDAEAFGKVFHSPGVSERVAWAGRMDKAYTVPSTPTLIIDGQYIVRGATFQGRLRIAQQLVDQALRRVASQGG
jgi:thiol:disulfide interchange protein DsbA